MRERGEMGERDERLEERHKVARSRDSPALHVRLRQSGSDRGAPRGLGSGSRRSSSGAHRVCSERDGHDGGGDGDGGEDGVAELHVDLCLFRGYVRVRTTAVLLGGLCYCCLLIFLI